MVASSVGSRVRAVCCHPGSNAPSVDSFVPGFVDSMGLLKNNSLLLVIVRYAAVLYFSIQAVALLRGSKQYSDQTVRAVARLD